VSVCWPQGGLAWPRGLIGGWIASSGRDPLTFAMHALRRTKATLICRRTGNQRRGASYCSGKPCSKAPSAALA